MNRRSKVPPKVAKGAIAKCEQALNALERTEHPIYCTECRHYKEWDSEYFDNAIVTQCMAGNYPISKAIPDGWYCAGGERK